MKQSLCLLIPQGTLAVITLTLLVLYSCEYSSSKTVEREQPERFNDASSKEIIVHSLVEGIIYDTSDIHPEIKKMMDEFYEKNRRDTAVEVRRYVRQKRWSDFVPNSTHH